MQPSATAISLPARYRVLRHIADGGMACVWAAEDTVLSRRVAVKLLAPHLAGDDAAKRRFAREARAAAGLSSHPNIVTIYDVGEHASRPFIVMELMEGGTVAAAARPDRERALDWLAQAARGLDAAHAGGVIHRDVKPGNLLLDGRGRLAIADFGIARVAHEVSVTQTGLVLGTAAYLAPEQARGEGAGPASDRYALAVVAYELLTGRRPWPDGPPSARALAPAPAPTGLGQQIDAAFSRGLASDPQSRWPSAGAFVAALGDAQEGTRPTRPLTTAVMPAARRSRLARPVALVALGLALLAVAGAVAIGGDDDPPGTPASEDRRTPPASPAPGPAAESSPPPGADHSREQSSAVDQQLEGHQLLEAGRLDEAIAALRGVVNRYPGDATQPVNPLGYALYDLGVALTRAGRPEEAIPILTRRLAFGNQTGAVQAALDEARAAAGDGGDDEKPGKGRGRGKDD